MFVLTTHEEHVQVIVLSLHFGILLCIKKLFNQDILLQGLGLAQNLLGMN